MHDTPSSTELIAAVRSFLTEVAMPNLTGHAAFSARVAANALALVERDLAGRYDVEARQVALYSTLLGADATRDLKALEAKLCAAIQTGDLGLETPDLLPALREIAQAQLLIDQPNYSGGAS
jgi:hypothetical protein